MMETLFFEKRSPLSLHIVKNTVSDLDFTVMHNVRTIFSFEIEGMLCFSSVPFRHDGCILE